MATPELSKSNTWKQVLAVGEALAEVRREESKAGVFDQEALTRVVRAGDLQALAALLENHAVCPSLEGVLTLSGKQLGQGQATVLRMAVEQNNQDMAAWLLARGEKVQGDRAPFLLMACFSHNNPAMLELLMEHGYKPRALQWNNSALPKPQHAPKISLWCLKKGISPLLGTKHPFYQADLCRDWVDLLCLYPEAREERDFFRQHMVFPEEGKTALWVDVLKSGSAEKLLTLVDLGIEPPGKGGLNPNWQDGMLEKSLFNTFSVLQGRGGTYGYGPDRPDPHNLLEVADLLSHSPLHARTFARRWAKDPNPQLVSGLLCPRLATLLDRTGFNPFLLGGAGNSILTSTLNRMPAEPDPLRLIARHWGGLFDLPGAMDLVEAYVRRTRKKSFASFLNVELPQLRQEMLAESLPEAVAPVRRQRL
jgi:hypothetical protein